MMPIILLQTLLHSRSREGAWIEIVREPRKDYHRKSRSREGAWIEMALKPLWRLILLSRSREGAWIEISIPNALATA